MNYDRRLFLADTHGLDPEPAYGVLSPQELDRMGTFAPGRRREFMLGRLLVRFALAEYGECSACDVPVSTNHFGALLTANGHVSMAHADDFILVGLSSSPIGVDIERVQPLSDDERALFLHASERSPVLDDIATMRSWTAKEAFLKLQGCGLARDPRHIVLTWRGENALCEGMTTRTTLQELRGSTYVLSVCGKDASGGVETVNHTSAFIRFLRESSTHAGRIKARA
jgi:phosphopantetheinyl transferase